MARTCSGLSRSAPGTPFSLSPYSAPVAPWKTGPVWLARSTVICCAVGGAALAGARTNGVVTAVAVANTMAVTAVRALCTITDPSIGVSMHWREYQDTLGMAASLGQL